MPIPRVRTRVWISTVRVLAPAAAIALLAGCTWLQSPVPPGRSVREVYDDTAGKGASDKLSIERERSPGTPYRVRPVIYPPKVLAVFVPEHLDLERDYKIGSHWIYVKLRDSSWVEEPIDREPLAQGDAGAADLEALKPLATRDRLTKMLVPYRAVSDGSPDLDPSSEKKKDRGAGESEFDVTTDGERP